MRYYGVEDDRVVVVPNAVSAQFAPVDRKKSQAAIARKFKITAPYVLTIGDLQPRKNPLGLIKAYEELIAHHPNGPLALSPQAAHGRGCLACRLSRVVW